MENKGWKKIYHANSKQKIFGVTILTDFKRKSETRDKEGNIIMIKGKIHMEDIIIKR